MNNLIIYTSQLLGLQITQSELVNVIIKIHHSSLIIDLHVNTCMIEYCWRSEWIYIIYKVRCRYSTKPVTPPALQSTQARAKLSRLVKQFKTKWDITDKNVTRYRTRRDQKVDPINITLTNSCLRVTKTWGECKRGAHGRTCTNVKRVLAKLFRWN